MFETYRRTRGEELFNELQGYGSRKARAVCERNGMSVRTLTADEVVASLTAVREDAAKIAKANGRVAAVGIGWGSDISFYYALKQPQLNGAVSFHGWTRSDPNVYVNPRVPILGL